VEESTETGKYLKWSVKKLLKFMRLEDLEGLRENFQRQRLLEEEV